MLYFFFLSKEGDFAIWWVPHFNFLAWDFHVGNLDTFLLTALSAKFVVAAIKSNLRVVDLVRWIKNLFLGSQYSCLVLLIASVLIIITLTLVPPWHHNFSLSFFGIDDFVEVDLLGVVVSIIALMTTLCVSFQLITMGVIEDAMHLINFSHRLLFLKYFNIANAHLFWMLWWLMDKVWLVWLALDEFADLVFWLIMICRSIVRTTFQIKYINANKVFLIAFFVCLII